MSAFLRLPPDLKKVVLDFLPDRGDQIALSETCKEWHSYAIAAVYRDLRFVCSMVREEAMDAAFDILSPENEGLKHIRSLTVVPGDHECPPTKCKTLDIIVKLFARLLPRNVLTSFRIDGCHVLNPKVYSLLHQRQRKLQTLRLDGGATRRGDCFLRELMSKGCLVNTSCMTQLQLLVTPKWSLKDCSIPRLPNLRELEIYVDGEGEGFLRPEVHDWDWNVPVPMPSLAQDMLKTLFAADDPDAQVPRFKNLERLAIRGVRLCSAGRSLRNTLASPKLNDLTIQGCRDVTAFLRFCADNTDLLPSLEKLAIADEQSETIIADALNCLLGRLNGLTSFLLAADLVDDVPPEHRESQHQALTKHADTLRYLYLRVSPEDAEIFLEQLPKFQRLQQLAIPNLGGNLLLEDMNHMNDWGVADVLAIQQLKQLKSLETFYILDQPIDEPVDETDDEHARTLDLRDYRYERLAIEIFCSAPQVKAFGVSQRLRYYDFESPAMPVYFLPAELIAFGGGRRIAASEVHDLSRFRSLGVKTDIFHIIEDSYSMIQIGREGRDRIRRD